MAKMHEFEAFKLVCTVRLSSQGRLDRQLPIAPINSSISSAVGVSRFSWKRRRNLAPRLHTHYLLEFRGRVQLNMTYPVKIACSSPQNTTFEEVEAGAGHPSSHLENRHLHSYRLLQAQCHFHRRRSSGCFQRPTILGKHRAAVQEVRRRLEHWRKNMPRGPTIFGDIVCK